MSRLFLLLVLLLLIPACAAPSTPLPSPFTPTVTSPVLTFLPSPSPSASPSPSPYPLSRVSPTSTPQPPTPTASPPTPQTPTPYHPRLSWPLPPEATRSPAFTYLYGSTQQGQRDPHHGLDFPNPLGTPVLAAEAGSVLYAGPDGQPRFTPWSDFYGQVIVLEHTLPGIEGPLYTLYGHLSTIEVSTGQSVRRGQVIGQVGMSGVALGSHLHFEVRLGGLSYGDTRNPLLWLPMESGSGLLIGRVQNAAGHPLHLILNLQPLSPTPAILPRAIETYALSERQPVNADERWGENLVESLPAGHYRLTLIWGGRLYENRLEIQPQSITYVVLSLP